MAVPVQSDDIRKAYLDFFQSKHHKVVPSSSLVPENDPTLLLANAGMNQFKPYFLGTVPFPHEVPYAASCQKCFRTGDLELVGYTARHHTFFEMLGNFSFGGYFKKEAIRWAWEFVTEVLKLHKERLWVSVYKDDDEAIEIWKKTAALPLERIARLGDEDNFWTMGPTGPCGPCSEVYVDIAPSAGPVKDFSAAAEEGRLLEIWNLVFTQFDRQANGTLKALPKPNIDTGMGLERTASVMQNVSSNFEIDLLKPLQDAVAQEAWKGAPPAPSSHSTTSLRVISDHLRATSFLIADGVLPSNEGRGYVLRRILRRAVRHGRMLGIRHSFLHKLVTEVVKKMSAVYPNLAERQDHVIHVVAAEEERFLETLDKGTDRLTERLVEMNKAGGRTLPGADAFMLYDTYGFPLDLTQEILKEQGLQVDVPGFEAAMEAQRDRARSAWSGSGEKALPNLYQELNAKLPATVFTGYEEMRSEAKILGLLRVREGNHEKVGELSEGDYAFILLDKSPFYAEKGGQVGDKGVLTSPTGVADVLDTQLVSERLIGHWCLVKRGVLRSEGAVKAEVSDSERRATMRNHTATHLLHAALRQVLGKHVQQAGSYVGPDRLRFDFSHFESVKPEQLRVMETMVNRKVLENLEVSRQEMGFQDAKKKGALAFFSEKYGERVRVVEVPGFSTELCGGTHVSRTGDIGLIKIVGEGSVAAGVRRLEAVTGEGALVRFLEAESALQGLAAALKTPENALPEKVDSLLSDLKEKDREISRLKSRLAANLSDDLLSGRKDVKGVPLVAARCDGLDPEGLRQLTDQLKGKLKSGIVVLGSVQDARISFIAGVTSDLTKRIKAGDIVKRVAEVAGGGGGGRPDMAQAGGKDASKVDEALAQAPSFVESLLK